MLLEITPDCPTRSPPRCWVGPEGLWAGACPAPRPRLACPPRVFVSSVRATSSDTKTTLAVVTREVESLRVITGRAGEHVRAYLRSGAGACAIRREENAEARDFLRRLKQQQKKSKKKASVRDMPQWRCVSFTRLGVSEWTSTHVQRGRFWRVLAEQRDRAKSFSDCRPKAGFQTGLQRFQSPRAELRLLCVCLISHGSDIRSERSSHPWGSSCRLVVTIFQRVLLPRSLPASVFWGCAVFKLLKN